MGPRRSARVSAIAQQAALDNIKTGIQESGPPVKEKKARKSQRTTSQNGITKNKSATKTAPKQTGRAGKGIVLSNTPKASAAASAAAAAVAAASSTANPNNDNISSTSNDNNPPFKIPPSTPQKRPRAPQNPPLSRPIDPHLTTATLRTPRGSHLTAYPERPEDASPSKTGLPRPPTTTGTLLEEAVAHLLSVAPQLQPVIAKYPCPLFSPAGLAEEIDPFNALASSIIGQQVSGAAAKSIKGRFIGLFKNDDSDKSDARANGTGANDSDKKKQVNVDRRNELAEMRYDRDDHFPTPQQVAQCDIATLRTAGLSQRKAEYIQGLAGKFASGELGAGMLLTASDGEVLEKLIAVRGLGRWSVEMFLCFGLKRMDVFSTGDLGVQRGMAAFAGRDVSKLKAKGGGKFKYMSEKEMVEIAAPFSPYRSLFMWYMWRIEDVDVTVMQ
ncbi:hypothetical protein AJ79_01751 [Helicocarpus griseus UAMH5409]|uniref:HhH-GPD domain-containing protein n=1 Tax=Helicocarpus griseus UAMH5409 TaxID=1447875 RepID=A0A2B7Y5B9_9EURO|nr:hypothetical protein AJ79_01751 [Helicocarpus griseus UAMH5409]